MDALEGFAENGTAKLNEEAVNICFEIYKRKLIPQSRYEELESSYSSDNPAYSLSNVLLQYGDHRVLPIATEFLKRKISEERALDALVRLDGKKHTAVVLQRLKENENFSNVLSPAFALYRQTQDKEIIYTIFKQLEKRKDETEGFIDLIVENLIETKTIFYLNDLEKILGNKQLIGSIRSSYSLSQGSVESIAADLYSLGVVDQKFDSGVIAKARSQSKEKEGCFAYIHNFLSVSGIHHWFDTETDMVPVDYNNLIKTLSKNSNGKFEHIKVWMDAVEVEAEDKIKYKIYLSANHKVYIIEPEDIGDWYELSSVLAIMNRALKDAGLKEKYVLLEALDQTAEIMFGPEEKVKAFAKKYLRR